MRVLLQAFTVLAIAAASLGRAESTAEYQSELQFALGHKHGTWDKALAQARSLVKLMTLEEKANITYGVPSDNVCAGNTGSVPRLGWPGMCLHDAGNGVRATDLVNSYPSAIHVGASWDADLTYRRGYYMGQEFKAKGVNVLLGPNAGPLGRTPLGGRNWEGFSVDPYLSGVLNAATISGMQSAGVIANLKHFIGNEQETLRRSYFGVEAVSSNIDDKTLHEFYLWPFVDGVRAGAASIMCSYNRVNGTYACMSHKLLNGILKDELGFQGFVLLDWNAQHDVQSANAGLDMVMPLGGAFGSGLANAVADGTVSEARLTDMATRIVAAWYLVGQETDFPVPGIGMQNLTRPHAQVDGRVRASRHTLLDAAVAGHVLVKNVREALPFLSPPRMISVFGYDAEVPRTKNTDIAFQMGYLSSVEMAHAMPGTETHFDQAAKGGTIVSGGRAGANSPAYIDSPLSAIQRRARKDGSWINWDLDSSDPDVNGASDVCLVFINAMATEGWDREGLRDDFSDNLVLSVASKCANTMVVIHAAGIRLVDQWIDHENITAVVIAHLPGQDGGSALVKLLYGEANFSGKLPYTLARNESDYAFYQPCRPSSEEDLDPQCDFTEGVFVDYRDFDAKNITPRYEFGFGLSYTTFRYSALGISHSRSLSSSRHSGKSFWSRAVTVTTTVKNSGSHSGYEVVQLYLAIPNSPPVQLRGFKKVWLHPGESVKVKFHLTNRDLSVWDVVSQSWHVQEGKYTAYVGASSRDVRLQGDLHVRSPASVELR